MHIFQCICRVLLYFMETKWANHIYINLWSCYVHHLLFALWPHSWKANSKKGNEKFSKLICDFPFFGWNSALQSALVAARSRNSLFDVHQFNSNFALCSSVVQFDRNEQFGCSLMRMLTLWKPYRSMSSHSWILMLLNKQRYDFNWSMIQMR